MKQQAIRTFLEEFFAYQNAKTEVLDRQVLRVDAPRKLANRIGVSPLRLAFSPDGLKADPASEMAMVGNPVFDRILDLAVETGRLGERFLRPPSRSVSVPPPPKHLGLGRTPAVRREHDQVYTPFYFFLFRIEFSLEEVPDNLETVPVDGITLESPIHVPDLAGYWDTLEGRPAAGRKIVPAFPVPEETVRAAIRILEHRLRKRIGRLRRIAQESLAKETRSISDYYQQLIEETRNASRRWVLPPGGKEERIRLLQLDWKRRTEEAEDNWKPRAEVALVAAGAVQRPRVRFAIGPSRSIEGRKKPGSQAGGAGCYYWDEADKVFTVPVVAG